MSPDGERLRSTFTFQGIPLNTRKKEKIRKQIKEAFKFLKGLLQFVKVGYDVYKIFF